MTSEIYLDGNATTAVLPVAVQASLDAMRFRFGNPSSSHSAGLQARALLESVRERARRVLGAGGGRLMFNSGATEGIQTAMLSALYALRERRDIGHPIGRWLVTGATEHKAVSESLAHWNRILGLNLEIVVLEVKADGRHDLVQLCALAPEAALVCTMAANNETGVISDLEGIETILANSPAYWIVDCVQALGKLNLDLQHTRIDYAPFSGHKLYAPKGIGMLYVRDGTPFTPLMVGGGQESGQRAGTENMAGIAALGAVLAALEGGMEFCDHNEMMQMRELLLASLSSAFPGLELNAPLTLALPTTINFSVPWLTSQELLELFDAADLRVSTGSACSAAKAEPSYVLRAMGLPAWQTDTAIRLSFGPLTTIEDIAAACKRIAYCGQVVRASAMIPIPTADEDQLTLEHPVICFSHGGHNSWLLADVVHRTCVLIDAHQAVASRIARHVRRYGYLVVGKLTTRLTAGIPTQSSITFDDQLLTAEPHGQKSQIWVLRRTGDSLGGAALAFIGKIAPADIPQGVVDQDTLLLPGDDTGLLLSTLRSRTHADTNANTNTSSQSEKVLPKSMIEGFLTAHPHAQLVDVRELHEQLGGDFDRPDRLPSASGQRVPMGHLASVVRAWLLEPDTPVVFYCRSGNRSARAAACLQSLGHRSAWTVGGGMVAAGDVLRHAFFAERAI